MKNSLSIIAVGALGALLFALPSWSAISGTLRPVIGAAIVKQNSVMWPVAYDGARKIDLRKRDIVIAKTGTADYSGLRIQSPTSTTRRIKLAGVTGDGTFRAQIAPGTARDAVGNRALGAGPSDPVTVDNTAPTLTISAPDPTVTNTGPVVFIITYDGADTITLKPEDIIINSAEGLTGDVAIEEISPTQRKVTITNIRKATPPVL